VTTSIAYGSTLILGALHALEPGHGKSFIAAYMVGEKLTPRHVVTLTLSLLVSHFLLLIIIALLMRFVFGSAVMQDAEEILSWAGPILILGFGVYLLLAHRHSHEEHNLFHTHNHSHDHNHQKNGSLRRSAVVGAIGGLLPCPTVFATILMSGAHNNFDNAIFYILIFILGMGVSLFVLISLFYILKESLVKKVERFTAKVHPHLASAILIIITGLVYLLIRIFGHDSHV
jgi:ABC-type nickel/cobalt efflux system permease component RcnA